jgi:hypothetical protein
MLKWLALVSTVVALAPQSVDADNNDPGDNEQGIGCPTLGGGCGLNGGWLGQNIAFHELDADTKNTVEVDRPGGTLRIVSFQRPRTDAPDAPLISGIVRVDRDQLKAVTKNYTYTGNELEGWYMTVEYARGAHANPETYYLKITKVHKTKYWTTLQKGLVPLYRFEWTRDLRKRSAPVCGPTIVDSDDQVQGTAVIFGGDHYDTNTFKITPSAGTQYSTRFNVACVGTALAKLHLHRHTEAAIRPAGSSPSVDDHQAVLRMLTADYCGNGESKSVNGRQLEYTYKEPKWQPNAPGFAPGPEDLLDGVWGANGAICVEHPRLGQPAANVTSCSDRSIPLCSTMNWPRKWFRDWNKSGYAVALWNRNVPNPPGVGGTPEPSAPSNPEVPP